MRHNAKNLKFIREKKKILLEKLEKYQIKSNQKIIWKYRNIVDIIINTEKKPRYNTIPDLVDRNIEKLYYLGNPYFECIYRFDLPYKYVYNEQGEQIN